jgi:hypothetical protein
MDRIFRILLNQRAHLSVLAYALLLMLSSQSGIAVASIYRVPDQLKAGYLFNIAKLIDWPVAEDAAKPPTFYLCAMTHHGLYRELEKISGRNIAGRNVAVDLLSKKSETGHCHIVFVGKEYTQTWFELHPSSQQGQLLVGEDPAFISSGGVINFYLDEEKLKFEISAYQARRLGIKINSRLLRLARLAESEPDE